MAAFDIVEEGATGLTPTQNKIIQNRDYYLPFRQLSPSKRVILGNPEGPFSPAKLRTREGFFDALIFRLITQASPILIQEQQVCFGSLAKFEAATEGKAKHHYCNPTATGQHSRFLNISHIPEYWGRTAGWSNYTSSAEITLESLLTWLTGNEGSKKRFYGMGNLVGWLLASDYAYAGLIEMPDASKVGEIIFDIDAGGKGGLKLLGFNVDTKEGCVKATRAVWAGVHELFTPMEIDKMGLDPITLEHALCKFKRLYRTCVAQVGWLPHCTLQRSN